MKSVSIEHEWLLNYLNGLSIETNPKYSLSDLKKLILIQYERAPCISVILDWINKAGMRHFLKLKKDKKDNSTLTIKKSKKSSIKKQMTYEEAINVLDLFLTKGLDKLSIAVMVLVNDRNVWQNKVKKYAERIVEIQNQLPKID